MSDETSRETDAAVIADLAAKAAAPHVVDPERVTVVSDGVQVLDLDRFRENPRRKAGTYNPATVDALISYVQEHVTDGTTFWVDKSASRVTAVVNDHSGSAPGWKGHVASLQLQQSPEWKHWLSKDAQYFDQEEFAEHLQDGIEEIREPDAATMLEIAQTIQGATKADWKTATRLDNGEVSFAYHEQIEATAGRKAHLEIPQTFTLAVSPFYGEAAPLPDS
jgi:uncharacterized protein YfdQ (DUF2303 family)